jgi:hypothetical protein
MAINETATGNDSVAITGTASAGERTVGVLGQGDSVGVKGVGKGWNAVEGISQSTIGGAGVFGANDTGAGVRGESKARFNPAVHGIHRGVEGPGVQGEAENGSGAIGISATWIGVYGETNAQVSAGASGVLGEGKDGGDGVKGHTSAPGKAGVRGDSREGIGVRGSSLSATGVWGSSRSGTGVIAESDTNTALWAICQQGWAGFFEGFVEVHGDVTVHDNVQIDGDVSVRGVKSFKIDHPLDPENRYLTHFSVEAPEAKNVYDGVSTLDEGGEAVVELPEWFEALNTDFRYQLTPIGAPAPNLYVVQEITDNSFKVAGGAPETKVSWQVTGVRKDILARADELPVEGEKPAK